MTSVLFLCKANSARSLIAEALFRQLVGEEFVIASAGTEPTEPHPRAIDALKAQAINTEGLRVTSINSIELADYDYIISLCDEARIECQQQAKGAHFIAWDIPDPAISKAADAFEKTVRELSTRLTMLLPTLRTQSHRPHLLDGPNEFFKVLADPLRLQMIVMLNHFGELCVCQFVAATGMSQPKVSRHLAQLREYGLLTCRKDQRWVYYRINPALQDWMATIIDTTTAYHPQLIPAQVGVTTCL